MTSAESRLEGVKSRRRRAGTLITWSAPRLADGGHGPGSKAIPEGTAWLSDRLALPCEAQRSRHQLRFPVSV